MKPVRTILLLVAVAVATFSITRHVTAQTSDAKRPQDALGAYDQLVHSLVAYGRTNTAAEVTRMVSLMQADRKMVDIGYTLAVLQQLRSGQTNEAINMLEAQLDDAVIGFDALPREEGVDVLLQRVKQYRAQFPHKSGHQDIDAAAEKALKSNAK